jgi:histidine kinase 2/3/4 (cytokinin receptor)
LNTLEYVVISFVFFLIIVRCNNYYRSGGLGLQFTKEGSILVCVRVMDPHFGHDSESGALSQKARAQVLPNDSPDQGLHYASGVLGSNDASLERGNTAPRLSIQPGDALNTREAVALWRDWKLTTTSGRTCKPPKNFTVIVSVEDTGTTALRHMFS